MEEFMKLLDLYVPELETIFDQPGVNALSTSEEIGDPSHLNQTIDEVRLLLFLTSIRITL